MDAGNGAKRLRPSRTDGAAADFSPTPWHLEPVSANMPPVTDPAPLNYRQIPSYQLTAPLPLLPTRTHALPCVQTPERFDPDQPLHIRQAAARTCRRECVALAACTALLASLPNPRGVIAGVVDTERLRRRQTDYHHTPGNSEPAVNGP
jgi:hypothetical protein